MTFDGNDWRCFRCPVCVICARGLSQMNQERPVTTPIADVSLPLISVALIACVRLYRDGLAAALGVSQHLVVVGTAANGSDSLMLVEQKRPDVAVIDMAMEDAHGLLRALHTKVPATG